MSQKVKEDRLEEEEEDEEQEQCFEQEFDDQSIQKQEQSIANSLRSSTESMYLKKHPNYSNKEERRGRPESTKMKNQILQISKYYPLIWQAQMTYVYESSNKTKKTSFANSEPITHNLNDLIPSQFQHVWAQINERMDEPRIIKLYELLTKLSFGKDTKYALQFFEIYFTLIEILFKPSNDAIFIQGVKTSQGLNNLVEALFKIPVKFIREFDIKTEKNIGETKFKKLLKAICYGFSATYHEEKTISDVYLK